MQARRPQIRDEQGQIRTLLTGAEAYFLLREGEKGGKPEAQTVVLGLVDGDKALFPGAWAVKMGENTGFDAKKFVENVELGADVWLHRQAQRLFPSFFDPLVAKFRLFCKKGHKKEGRKKVWLPGSVELLLHQELKFTLEAMGFCVEEAQHLSAENLQENPPDFVLSVNARGLLGNGEEEGAAFFLCKEWGIPVVLWLVDNPWLIFSGLRKDWWKKTFVFVTDPSFLPLLKEHGAENVDFLPLGVSQIFALEGEKTGPQKEKTEGNPVVFVGSSSFGKKNQYFAAARVDENLLAHATKILQTQKGEKPHFHWWAEHTQEKNNGVKTSFWPGYTVRPVAAGAEACSQQHRVAWLKAALPCGLDIYGDSGWENLLEVKPAPPIAYGKNLAALYHQAAFSLDIASLLLPQGLSQRHFDVWPAGGFLLSTATQAMALFPEELVKPVSLTHYADLPEKVHFFTTHPTQKQELKQAWRCMLAEAHTYKHRIMVILQSLGIQA